MSSPVLGRLAVLEIWIDDAFFPVLCGTDLSLHLQQEVILKTGPNSGAWREKTTRLSEWNASVTGLTKIENSSESVTFFWTLQESVRLTTQLIRLTFQDEDGGGKQVKGYAVIVSQDINGPATDFSTASIVFEGTGHLEIDEIEGPIESEVSVLSDWWETVNGNNYIDGASTGNFDGTNYTLGASDRILDVAVNGEHFNQQLSGTVLNGHFEFISGSNKIQFEAGLIFTGSEEVFVIWDRI